MKPGNIALLVLGFIMILFGALYTLTREVIFESWAFSDTGQIGDTIGGITAPFINIAGSLLIFASFLSQNKANRIQAEQNVFSLLHELYKDLKDDLNSITFYSASLKNGKIYRGVRAVSVFSNVLKSRKENKNFKQNSVFSEVLFVMGSFCTLLDIVESSTVNEREKIYVMRLIHFLYLTRVREHIEEIITTLKGVEIHSAFYSTLSSYYQKIESSYGTTFESMFRKGV